MYSYYIKNSNPNKIINEFSNKYIIATTSDIKIDWKNLHFVWKQFLSNYNLPSVIYSNSLKNILKTLFTYEEETDSFIGITSKYLPVHIDFINFWESTITVHQNNILFDNELEIDELCSLFKFWTKQSFEPILSNCNISEENVLKILKHFFPAVEIVEDKYVLNVTCSLWNKIEDIENSFVYMKEQIKKETNCTLVSFDNAYNYYYKNCNLKNYKFISSKRYFEKYLYFKISHFIVYEKFIEIKWVTEI
jgi:hypothetical protein